jgi:hypothetical protein
VALGTFLSHKYALAILLSPAMGFSWTGKMGTAGHWWRKRIYHVWEIKNTKSANIQWPKSPISHWGALRRFGEVSGALKPDKAVWGSFRQFQALSGVLGRFRAVWGSFVSAIFSKWFHVSHFLVLCCGGFPGKSSVCGQV